jgi:hypothetical protein
MLEGRHRVAEHLFGSNPLISRNAGFTYRTAPLIATITTASLVWRTAIITRLSSSCACILSVTSASSFS